MVSYLCHDSDGLLMQPAIEPIHRGEDALGQPSTPRRRPRDRIAARPAVLVLRDPTSPARGRCSPAPLSAPDADPQPRDTLALPSAASMLSSPRCPPLDAARPQPQRPDRQIDVVASPPAVDPGSSPCPARQRATASPLRFMNVSGSTERHRRARVARAVPRPVLGGRRSRVAPASARPAFRTHPPADVVPRVGVTRDPDCRGRRTSRHGATSSPSPSPFSFLGLGSPRPSCPWRSPRARPVRPRPRPPSAGFSSITRRRHHRARSLRRGR